MSCAIIPARSGSKAIKDKNTQILNNIPLLAHSIKVAQSVPEIDRIIVSTDSEFYADIAEEYGAEVPFIRPEEISGDDSCDIEWVLHLINEIGWTSPELLVHLRPTSPLRDPVIISRAIKHVKENPDCTSLRSVTPLTHPIAKLLEIDGSYLKSASTGSFNHDGTNKPRHLYPTSYQGNGYVDVLKTDYVLKNRTMHGDKVIPFLTPRITDIDTMDDLEYVRYEMSKI